MLQPTLHHPGRHAQHVGAGCERRGEGVAGRSRQKKKRKGAKSGATRAFAGVVYSRAGVVFRKLTADGSVWTPASLVPGWALEATRCKACSVAIVTSGE